MHTSSIVLLCAVLLVLYVVSIYERLVKLRNNRENAFADVDAQLRRWYDLIAHLLEISGKYMIQEKTLLAKVAEARNKALSAVSISAKIQAEDKLATVMETLKEQAEAYSGLTINPNYRSLQDQITVVANALAASKTNFNSTTKKLNANLRKFPNTIIANVLNFKTAKTFRMRETKETPTPAAARM